MGAWRGGPLFVWGGGGGGGGQSHLFSSRYGADQPSLLLSLLLLSVMVSSFSLCRDDSSDFGMLGCCKNNEYLGFQSLQKDFILPRARYLLISIWLARCG